MLAGAASCSPAHTLAILIDLGVDLNAYSPTGFHPHGTALHHALGSGSLDAVKVLVEAGAQPRITADVLRTLLNPDVLARQKRLLSECS